MAAGTRPSRLSGCAPVAWRYLAGVLAVLAATVGLAGALRGAGLGEAQPLAFRLYLLAASATLAALALTAVLADLSWFWTGGRTARLDADDITDPVAGVLAPFRHADSPVAAALRVEQAGHIFRQLDVMMAINIVNALLVATAIYASVSVGGLATWLTVVLGGAGLGIRTRLKAKGRPAPKAVSKRSLRRITFHAGLRGLAWGLCFLVFFSPAEGPAKLALLSVSLGMLAGGVPALAPVPSAALLFALGIAVPTLLRLVSIGQSDYVLLALFGLAFMGSMVMVASQIYRNFAENLTSRLAKAEQAATISMLLNEFEASASDFLWETDATGRLTRLPERMARMLSIGPQSGDGPTLAEALAASDGADKVQLFRCVAACRPFRNLVLASTDASGRRRWLSLSASPKAEGGYRGVGSDHTVEMAARLGEREATQRARKAEQRLQDGIASLSEGFVLTDDAGHIAVSNQRFLEIFGDAAGSGAGMQLEHLIEQQGHRHAPASTSGAAVPGATTPAPDACSHPLDMELPNDRWLRVRSSPTTEGGTVTILTEVTDIKRKERQLASQAQKLTRSNNELQHFASVASHDLQEPLRKIEAFGQRLAKRLEGRLDEDCANYLERMTAASGRMRRLITDLLAYSRVGKQAAPRRDVDLDGLLADVLDDLSVAISERQASVVTNELGSMPCDLTLMRQLFQNLISNALKFASPDRACRLEMRRVDHADGAFELRFRDNGIGFDMANHDKIFEIFQRLHGRDAYEGSGIGLATCRRIVERHGGTLRAESVPGEGATFIASFPARHAMDAVAA